MPDQKPSALALKMNDDQFAALTNYLSDIRTELNRIANALENITFDQALRTIR